jgi:photosystem II stability/assembly factor-like uncharacterized protein
VGVLVLGAGAIRTAGANQQDNRVVALAYDRGTDSLLKAQPRTLYRSSDGGQSWQAIAIPSLKNGRISSVAASPPDKGVIYVVGPGLGVLRTEDGGKSWVERNEGLPSRDVSAVAAHTTQPETVYIVVPDHGVYRSQDAGKTWRIMDHGSQDGIRQLIHSDLAGSMQTGWLFAATLKGIRRTMDCFCLWQDAGKLGTEVHGVSYDPRQPEHIYVATEKGILRSMDGGENWVQTTSPGSKVVALAFARSGTLYAMDAGGTLFRSADDGTTWVQVDA